MNSSQPNQVSPSEQASGSLFDVGEPISPIQVPPRAGVRRLKYAQRDQVLMRCLALDALLPAEHTARVVWAFVEGLDLTRLYERIQAVEGGPGQAPADPRILLALWLYATLESVGSARALDRLCEEHLAYQGLAGEVGMNYHTLSDFRTAHPEFLDALLTQSVADEGKLLVPNRAAVKVDAVEGAAAVPAEDPTECSQLRERLLLAAVLVGTHHRHNDEDDQGRGDYR